MRLAFPLGILLALAGMAGLWHYAGALPGAFAVLTIPAVQPLPPAAADAASHLSRLQLSALLYAAGCVVICGALRGFGRERTLSAAGKLAVALGAAATIGGAALTFAAWWQVRQDFRAFALSPAPPQPDELSGAIVEWQRQLPRGFGLATIGLLAMLVAALPSLQAACVPARQPGRETALPLVALLAIGGLAGAWILACQGGSAAFAEIAGQDQPRPAQLAGHLDTIIRYGLIGAVCLATLAATQALAALVLPRSGTRTSD